MNNHSFFAEGVLNGDSLNRDSLGEYMAEITLTPILYVINNLTWLAVGVMLTLMMIIAARGDGF
jgi:hypothetical protein